MEEEARFSIECLTYKSSAPNGSIGEKKISSALSLSNDEGCSLGRTNHLIFGRRRTRVF